MTLIEVLVSAALSVILGGAVLSLVVSGQALARTQPESLDVQQRGRVALQVLARDLRDAGAGIDAGTGAGPLASTFPPIAPSTGGGITLWTATDRNAQSRAAVAVALGATAVPLEDAPVCPPGQGACGFAPGASLIVFTNAGCRTTSRVAAAAGAVLQLAAPLAGCALEPGSVVAAGDVRTYTVDPVANRLVRRDESNGFSVPVLDGVASMRVELFADVAASSVAGTTDAELARVRRVRLTLRFIAANRLLNVPDLDVVVDVAPRNMQGG